jgi:hypothetical protein
MLVQALRIGLFLVRIVSPPGRSERGAIFQLRIELWAHFRQSWKNVFSEFLSCTRSLPSTAALAS